jgi:hypothetical protein
MSMTTISPSLGTITMRIDPHVCYALIDGADQIELLRATSNAALDMIALTGIGSIKSFDAIQRDYDKLILLEKAGILSAPDSIRLTLHRELRTRSTILPGFTATSSDGLTVTALFPAETTTISIETILQHLGIDGTDGSTKTPAGVICALINAANGIAVAHPTTAGHIALVNALITAGQLHAIDRAVEDELLLELQLNHLFLDGALDHHAHGAHRAARARARAGAPG